MIYTWRHKWKASCGSIHFPFALSAAHSAAYRRGRTENTHHERIRFMSLCLVSLETGRSPSSGPWQVRGGWPRALRRELAGGPRRRARHISGELHPNWYFPYSGEDIPDMISPASPFASSLQSSLPDPVFKAIRRMRRAYRDLFFYRISARLKKRFSSLLNLSINFKLSSFPRKRESRSY